MSSSFDAQEAAENALREAHTPDVRLVAAVCEFIVLIRDRGMGRFMPDELPLLNEMAETAGVVQRRWTLEQQRLDRKHVSGGNRLSFTYRPTLPSGPPPEEA